MKFAADILAYTGDAEAPAFSQNAERILADRFLQKDKEGESLESPDKLFRRVARAVSQAELNYGLVYDAAYWEEAFYQAMRSLLFLPNSPTLMHAGRPGRQLSACFVLPIEENIDRVLHVLHEATQIQLSGGGTGFNFSTLPPQDALSTKAALYSPGPVSVIRMFSKATEHIGSVGHRRGANMAILNIDHPDIEAFIRCKKDENTLRNFTISVGIPDAFMRALVRKAPWQLLHPRSRRVIKTVKPHKLWNMLVQAAWKSGEPGLIFLDNLQRNNPLAALGPIHATNPCAEMPLLPYESCCLGSVNLARMTYYRHGVKQLDWDKLASTVRLGIRFLDNVIDVDEVAIARTGEVSRANRKIGLGVMGWADLLIQLEVPYHSLQAVRLAGQIMEFIQRISLETSVWLAQERGPFVNWKKSTYFQQQLEVRNATRNSIAPTGTLAMIADTSPSIEPLYALAYRRAYEPGGQGMYETSRAALDYMQAYHFCEPSILEQIYHSGSVQGITALPRHAKSLLKTSTEIPFRYHLKHQQAFQRFTDNAVSKTINLPAGSSLKEIDRLYRMAWQLGLKGITVYRNSSRARQVLSVRKQQARPGAPGSQDGDMRML